MSRIPRNYHETNYFHVLTQGINKSYIFRKSTDINYYINIMYSLSKNLDIKIIAYCIMNNHTHMLVKVKNIHQLSEYMKCLNSRYAKYYNYTYNRIGYVYRDRFKSQGIYNEEQFKNCIYYIFNNPVNAKLCNSPSEYPYSNYKDFRNLFIHSPNITYDFIDTNECKDYYIKTLINMFLKENHCSKNYLLTNFSKLSSLISFLKDNHNISLRTIAKELNLNREFLRKLYNLHKK